ncbi:MAG: hypothetical protein J5922_01110 [Clostridia bacterium]|nr:hypothetical protein [Clostridia bacterium]
MKNMEKANVIILNVGDSQYPQDYLGALIEEVNSNVRKMNCNVLAEYTIMNEKDAIAAKEGVKSMTTDLFIINFVSWHITPYVMNVVKNYRNVPLLIWGIGGFTDKSGKLVSPAAAAGITGIMPIVREMGYKYKLIAEKPDTPHSYDEVSHYIDLVGAAKKIRASKIGLIGYADMHLYTCAYDMTNLFKQIGICIEDYSGYEIANLMKACPEDAVKKIMDDVKASYKFENQVPDKVLENVCRLYYVMKNKADGHALDAISIKCVHGTTSALGFNPCLAQTLLADKDLSVICECDAYGLVTSIILSTITGHASAFMEHYEVFDSEVLVGVCGFIPPEFADGIVKIRSANLGEVNTGISNVSKVRTGEVTFGRFYSDNGKFKLFLSKGEAKPNPKWTEIGWEEPTPDFPAVMLKLNVPMQKYLENVPGQHIIMVYGDYIEDVKTVCGLLDIEIVM